MYADKLEQEGATTSPNEPERPPTPDEQPSSPDQDRVYKHPPVTNILLLGPSGSGKSSLFNLATDDYPQHVQASKGPGLCTAHFRISRTFYIHGRSFRLIDSPGFHTNSLSDAEIMKRLVQLLMKSSGRGDHIKRPPKLSGILYLHPIGGGGEDERLKGTMESLRRLVGDPWLPAIMIAVLGDSDPDSIAQLKGPTSPFHSLHSGGAKIEPLSLELPKVREMLSGFDPVAPAPPRLFQKVRLTYHGNLDGLYTFIEEIAKPPRQEPAGRAARLKGISLEESEASRQQLQTTLDENEVEFKALRSQLEQTQLEYASLRSELQLNDNTEQSKIVQSLQDLNRAIDDFGRSVAEYMVDNFAASLNKEDPTTLDASDLTELQRQFGHQEGQASLTASSEGGGLPIEDFIDLSLRSFLCRKLSINLFNPFHPTLAASTEPGFMASLYEEVRSQGSATVAAKWRASSFVALSKGQKLDKSSIEGQAESLIAADIQPLLNNLFGQTNVATLTENQRSQLQEIVTAAWELNYVLKGEVVTLGDFQPLYYERGAPFDPKAMVEFEPDKKKKPGDIAICTVRLGLTLSHSKGAGKDAKPLVICSATVVTPTVYG